MADEDTTLETGDSVQDSQEAVDWQKRFTDTQAEYTRNQQALADERKVWEDEQALLARISEKYPHLIAEEDEDEEPDVDDVDSSYDEPDVMTKAEFKAWQEQQRQEQAAEKAQAQFEQDFTRFVGDRELDQYGNTALRAGQYKGPEELQAAIDEYFEYLDGLGAKPRKRKTTPAIQGGQAATGVPDYGEMSRSDIDRLMVERVQAARSQT